MAIAAHRPTRALAIATFAASLLLGSNHAMGETPRAKLVVLDLVSERGLDEGTVRLLNELLLTEFQRSGRYDVVGGSDLKALLSLEEEKNLLGCSDVACMAQIGGALGADFLAISSIGRIGDFFLLNVKIISTETATVLERWTTQVEGVENKLMAAIRESVSAVTGDGSQPQTETQPTATETHASQPKATEPEPVEAEEAGQVELANQPAAAEVAAVEPPDAVEATTVEEESADGSMTMWPWPWMAAGLSVASLAAGGALGFAAWRDVKYAPMDPRYVDAHSAAETKGLWANVAFGVGAAAAIAAGVLFFLGDPDPADLPVLPTASPDSVGLSVVF